MDESGAGSFPCQSHLRCFVHFSIDAGSLPSQSRAEIDFSGSRPGEFQLIAQPDMMDNRDLLFRLQQIVEYDVLESLKESRGLVIAFHKRIFQCALPVSMTLVYNVKAGEDQLLIADTDMKFKLFDKNTFEILATFLGPIYDSNVQQFVSIYGATIQIYVDGLKVPLSFFLFELYPFFMVFFFFT
jgi:hypothetical protein